MKTIELRIGNYVRTYGQDVGHRTIVGITPEGVNLLEQDEKIDYNLIEPIPLTEEWLEKFGFEDYGSDSWFKARYENENLCINILKSGEFCVEGVGVKGESGMYIEYVHQLQNLYFALTAEELEIK